MVKLAIAHERYHEAYWDLYCCWNPESYPNFDHTKPYSWYERRHDRYSKLLDQLEEKSQCVIVHKEVWEKLNSKRGRKNAHR